MANYTVNTRPKNINKQTNKSVKISHNIIQIIQFILMDKYLYGIYIYIMYCRCNKETFKKIQVLFYFRK